jgi:hypothetical protein
MRPLFVVVRVAGAILIVAAMVVQMVHQIGVWKELGIQHLENIPINFFSYFTIDSNVGTVVVFAIGAVVLLRRIDDPRWFGILRACVVSYMTVTGIVYNTLLRGLPIPVNSVVPWTNEVLHVIGPILIVADWLLAPGRLRLEWKNLWWVVSFPLVWAVYTMIRGPLAYNDVAQQRTWYPYPFLNPANSPEGYVSVGFYIVLIAAIICGVGAAVIWVTRRRARWPLPARAAAPA